MRIHEWIKLIERLKGENIGIVHVSALQALTGLSGPSLNVALWRLEKKGLISRVAKNLICLGRCEVWDIVRAVFPSAYISLEWALHYHEILDQYQERVTLLWLGKPRIVRRGNYTFELHHISKRLYFGFDPSRVIAEPEKALLDTIYIRKSLPPELNFDLLEKAKLRLYMRIYPRRVRRYITMHLKDAL